jgi:hypothetical protein
MKIYCKLFSILQNAKPTNFEIYSKKEKILRNN